MTDAPKYPHQDGDVTVLGPEVFASKDNTVISWRGTNYVRHDENQQPHYLTPDALYELASAVRDLASALRLEQAPKSTVLTLNTREAPQDIGRQVARTLRRARRRGGEGGPA